MGRGRITIGLYNSYDQNFREPHRRVIARAGDLARAYDMGLALFGFPIPENVRTPKEIAEWVAGTTSIGGHGRNFMEMAEAGRFNCFPYPGKGFPPQLGEVVLTTCRPDPRRQISLTQTVDMVEGGQSITLLFGIGPHGVPKNVMAIPRYNLDITPGGYSLETCTALGAVCGALYARLWHRRRPSRAGKSPPGTGASTFLPRTFIPYPSYDPPMSDVGYSSDYEVYLTQHNGIQIVTNELSLQLLREMRHREISPTEMATMLNLSKSTIQGNIAKLLRSGIVESQVRIDDARSAVYHIEAMLLFSSYTGEDWQLYARAASVKRIMRNGRCTAREDLSLYCVSLMESGFNISQGLFNVGVALTRGTSDSSWWDSILGGISSQCEKDDIEVDLDTSDALTLTFTSKGEDISDIPLILVPMLGALRAHSKVLIGHNLSHDIRLSVDDKGHSVRLRVDPFEGQDYEADYDSNPYDSFSIDEPFAVYSVNGRAMLFTNPTMMSLLEALSDHDQSLNELERTMRIPKATIYASVSKLITLGAVEIDENSGTPKKYTLLAEPILYITDPEPEGVSKLNRIVADFQAGRLDYYSAVISYALGAIDCMGIHFDKMFMRAGKNTALTVLSLSDIEPQAFVDLACNMVSGPDRADVITYLPIKILLFLSKDTLWEAWPADFVMGFLNEGLHQLLGFDYPVTIETIHEATAEMDVLKSRVRRPPVTSDPLASSRFVVIYSILQIPPLGGF